MMFAPTSPILSPTLASAVAVQVTLLRALVWSVFDAQIVAKVADLAGQFEDCAWKSWTPSAPAQRQTNL